MKALAENRGLWQKALHDNRLIVLSEIHPDIPKSILGGKFH